MYFEFSATRSRLYTTNKFFKQQSYNNSTIDKMRTETKDVLVYAVYFATLLVVLTASIFGSGYLTMINSGIPYSYAFSIPCDMTLFPCFSAKVYVWGSMTTFLIVVSAFLVWFITMLIRSIWKIRKDYQQIDEPTGEL